MTEVITISRDELESLIKDTVKDTMQQELTDTLKQSQQSEWMTSDEVQEYLGVDGRKLKYLRDTRDIPFSQTGRTIFYPTDELEEWLRSNMPKEWRERKN